MEKRSVRTFDKYIYDGTKMCMRAEEGCCTCGLNSNAIDISVAWGFFNVPVRAPTRATLLTVIPRNRPILSPFKTRWGYGGPILILNPGSPRGTTIQRMNIESLALSQKQLAEIFPGKDNLTLYRDETPKFGKGNKHYGYHASDEYGQLYTLGLRQIPTKSSKDTLSTFHFPTVRTPGV